MNVSFNEMEQRLLRFLKDEFLEKGSQPTTMHDPATMHRDVMERFDLEPLQYREIIARLEHHGIVQFNPAAVEAPNGHLRIDPMIVQVVRQLDDKDEQAEQTEQRPDRMDQVKKYFYGQWWFVALVIGLVIVGVVAAFISNMKTILQWLGLQP